MEFPIAEWYMERITKGEADYSPTKRTYRAVNRATGEIVAPISRSVYERSQGTLQGFGSYDAKANYRKKFGIKGRTKPTRKKARPAAPRPTAPSKEAWRKWLADVRETSLNDEDYFESVYRTTWQENRPGRRGRERYTPVWYDYEADTFEEIQDFAAYLKRENRVIIYPIARGTLRADSGSGVVGETGWASVGKSIYAEDADAAYWRDVADNVKRHFEDGSVTKFLLRHTTNIPE